MNTQTKPPLPRFEKPPVVETIIGVQFEPLANLTNAHLGAFWKRLGEGWPKVQDVPPMEPQFEIFGDDGGWVSQVMKLRLTQDPSSRLQIRNPNSDRMIQIQNGRLIYNWISLEENDYPSYKAVRPGFLDHLATWRQFVTDESLGEFEPNQWEVTYINHIPKDTVWEKPGDWFKLFRGPGPGSGGRTRGLDTIELESLQGHWTYEIKPKRGRLHVQLRHGLRGQDGKQEVMLMTLIARGPVGETFGSQPDTDDPSDPQPLTLDEGIDLGHETIVTAFKELTSDQAHEHWKLIGD